MNVIRHLLSLSIQDLTPEPLTLPPLEKSKYVRPPMHEQNFIPEVIGRREPTDSRCEPHLR